MNSYFEGPLLVAIDYFMSVLACAATGDAKLVVADGFLLSPVHYFGSADILDGLRAVSRVDQAQRVTSSSWEDGDPGLRQALLTRRWLT